MKKYSLLLIAFPLTLGLAGCASNPKSLPDPPAVGGSTDRASSKVSDKKSSDKKSVDRGATETRAAEAPRFSDTLKDMDGDRKREKADPYALMTCSNAEEVRTISVASKEGGCEVVYEKHGKLNVPAYTAHGTQHCFNAREKIKDRLVAAGWKCQQ